MYERQFFCGDSRQSALGEQVPGKRSLDIGRSIMFLLNIVVAHEIAGHTVLRFNPSAKSERVLDAVIYLHFSVAEQD